ncbi:MAG: hypothetical protein FJ291_18200 [Planctomycetes bacterium]|nr:hypothetical protein [Planctomycetota bacterium]
MSTAVTEHPPLARRGQAYYDEHLRARLEPEHDGRFLALDVETGDYEVDEDEMAAIQRARAKHPQTLFYVLRIGHRAAHRIGGKSLAWPFSTAAG